MSIGPSGNSPAVVEVSECASAEEFLHFLDPLNPLWLPLPSSWIFRGHGDATWPLLAKAHRSKTDFRVFGVDVLPADEPHSMIRSQAERQLLGAFHRALDQAGLSIPLDTINLTNHGVEIGYSSDTPRAELPLLALAQHFGLPTTLLDWPRHAAKAAYFAAADAATVTGPNGTLGVWGLRADVIDAINHWSTDPRLRLVTAPAGSNPNLHAQSGLFTQSRGDQIFTVDAFVASSREDRPDIEQRIPAPWMRHVRLPQAHAPRLLRLLSYTGINGSAMFPGYEGVVKRIREEVLWDHD